MELGDERIVDDYYSIKKTNPSTVAATPISSSAGAPVLESTRQHNLVGSQELQSLTRGEFQDYVKRYTEYTKALTPDMDKHILGEAEEQLKLINAECARRAVKKANPVIIALWLFVAVMVLYAIVSKLA